MVETIKTSPGSSLFFTIVPNVALAAAVAAIAVPPTSVPLVVILLFSTIILHISAGISYRTRVNSFSKYDNVKGVHNDEEEQDEKDDITFIEYYNILQQLMKPSLPIICLFYASGAVLIITLTIRIFSVNQFGGNPSLLDYGPKVSKDGQTGDTNIALEQFDFDTFAHAIQGLLAALFSYSAVSGFLAKVAATAKNCMMSNTANQEILTIRPCVFSLNLLQVIQSALTYYPFYSMVKRLRYSSFSQTSHLNNATEWSLGLILGVSLGSLVSSLIQRQLVLKASSQEKRNEIVEAFTIDSAVSQSSSSESETKEKRYVFGKASEFRGITKYPGILRFVEALSMVNLILFSITSLLTGLFIGLSWNYDEENDKSSVVMITIFIGLFFATFIFFMYLGRWKR